MASTLKALRALSAPPRVRLVALLSESELTVRELTDITGMRQSGISMHLGQLQDAGLVESSRDGKNAYYRVARGNENRGLIELAAVGAAEIPARGGFQNLKRILERGKIDPPTSTAWPAGSTASTARAVRGRRLASCS